MYGQIDQDDRKDIKDQADKACADRTEKKPTIHQIELLFPQEHDRDRNYDKKSTTLKFYIHLFIPLMYLTILPQTDASFNSGQIQTAPLS